MRPLDNRMTWTNLVNTDDEKAQMKKNHVINDSAIACLTISFLSEEDVEYLEDSATVMYVNGIVSYVIESLKSNYRPVDGLSAVEAEQEMRKVKMSATENTEIYFTKAVVVTRKYRKSKTFNKTTLIANTMSSTPDCYHDTMAQ